MLGMPLLDGEEPVSRVAYQALAAVPEDLRELAP